MVNFRVKTLIPGLQLLTLIFFSGAASAQSSTELRNIFIQAESYFLYEEYELANPLYLMLDSPDNMNIKYKIGTCYLNIPGEKEKAIPYLEQAVKNASYESKTESFTEKKAPLDVYFSLAKAYMINNQLDKALNTFQTFNNLTKSAGAKGEMKNSEFIDQEIQACKNAVQYENKPVIFSKKMLGQEFSKGSINENPAVSYDGNSIVYTEQRGMINAIMYSVRERGVWQTPVDITSIIHAGEDCSTCSLNKDGTEMFLYKDDGHDGNIYSSSLVNGSWTPIKKLNKNINTKYYESHACISADGKKLYFTSNRDGGFGSLDIFVSEKDASDDWGPAVNLGNIINTPYNEDTPFITQNDSVLYFSSEGHNSMGGYDIFKSTRQGTGWSTPVNMGFPINTTDDDKFFQPVNDGRSAYYSMTTDYKKKDIYFLGMGGAGINQIFEIMGNYSLSDTSVKLGNKYFIDLIKKPSGDTINVGYPDEHTGHYSFKVPSGSYKLTYVGYGFLTRSIDTSFMEDYPDQSIVLNITMDRDTSISLKPAPPAVYEKVNLENIPVVAAIDSSILVKNMKLNDVNDANVKDSEVLYYTVQVMALHNPVDISYFKHITDMKVMYNDSDRFFRYTTGRCATREKAVALRLELIRKGYPEEIFIKKVSK